MGGKDLPSYPEKSLPPIHLNHLARVCMQAQQSVYKVYDILMCVCVSIICEFCKLYILKDVS